MAAGTPDEIIYNESVRKVYLGEHFKLWTDTRFTMKQSLQLKLHQQLTLTPQLQP